MTTSADATTDRIAFLRGLRSVRTFRPDAVPPRAIDDVLDVARWSGSASNRQPWQLLVVQNRDTLRRLSAIEGATARHLATAPLAIFLVMDGAPDKVPHETYDEGRLSERIMLAADAHGLGSCIGWFTGRASVEAKALLGIPEEKLVRTAISIGYADEAAHKARNRPAVPRKPQSEIVHRERYS